MIYSHPVNLLRYWWTLIQLQREMSRLCKWQAEIIQARNQEIDFLREQMLKLELHKERGYFDLLVNVRRALDEEDVGEHIEQMMSDVADLVARLEEQVV